MKSIACCLRHQGVADGFMQYQKGIYVMKLKDIADKYFKQIKD